MSRFTRDHRWAPARMSAYADGEIRPTARARMERHVAECPECRGVLITLERLLVRIHRLPEADVDPMAVAAVASAVAAQVKLSEAPDR